jgi:hypothetical protein
MELAIKTFDCIPDFFLKGLWELKTRLAYSEVSYVQQTRLNCSLVKKIMYFPASSELLSSPFNTCPFTLGNYIDAYSQPSSYHSL